MFKFIYQSIFKSKIKLLIDLFSIKKDLIKFTINLKD